MTKIVLKENDKEKIDFFHHTTRDNKQTIQIKVYTETGKVKWNCSENDIKRWSQELKEFYSKVLLMAAKGYVEDEKLKFNYFLLARSVRKNTRSFAEVSRGLTSLLTEEEKEEVKFLKTTAENYFNCDIDLVI